MSYQDLEETRAKREAKDQAAATKGKRGRKQKTPATEEAETGPSVPESNAVTRKETEPANIMKVSWRALVAKMYWEEDLLIDLI